MCACRRNAILHLVFYYFIIINVTIIISYKHLHIYIFTVKPIFHHNGNRLALGFELGMTPNEKEILTFLFLKSKPEISATSLFCIPVPNLCPA